MINFTETAWARMDFGAPVDQKDFVEVASAAGTAGTTETILYHPATGNLYRRRSWFGSSRSGPSGAVWFIAIREDATTIRAEQAARFERRNGEGF